MAFIQKDGQKLYLKSWEYNMGRMFNELATIVENNGGRVGPGYHWANVYQGSIMERMHELERKIARVDNLLDGSIVACPVDLVKKRKDVRNTYVKELAELTARNPAPIRMEHFQTIQFSMNSMCYYVSLDPNPLFDQHYIKTKITEDGTYSLDALGDELDVRIAYDYMWTSECSTDQVREIANQLFNWLMTAKVSDIRIDYKTVRVSNLYDNGYHYENVPERERRAKANW